MALPTPTDTARDARTRQLVTLGNQAAQHWRDEEVLPQLREGTRAAPDEPRRWQMLGLALRNLDRHGEALDAIEQAVRLAPGDALLAHTLARTTLEAGLPAVDRFERAHALAPLDGPVIQGRAAALLADGRASAAIALIADQLRAHPDWHAGHATLARLHWLAGAPERFDVSFVEALKVRPGDGILWRDYALTAYRAGRYAQVRRIVADARHAVGASRILDLIEAAACSEAGDAAMAERVLGPGRRVEPDYLLYQVRHLLRSGRPEVVVQLLEPMLGASLPRDLWPLLGLAWRLTGDQRAAWLDRDDDLVRVFDLAHQLGPMDDIAHSLRALHRAVQQPLDQSLRGGTQTDGPLFSRLDPALRRLRTVILGAVRTYVDQLPAPDPGHPLLGSRRAGLRFAGSWSVRLTNEGHHVDHVHPAGWISSAFYVALPASLGGDADRAGWLVIGDAPTLGVSLPPVREIEPRPGRLVLFPSTTWHRTRAFAAGERLTVAFDIARAPG